MGMENAVVTFDPSGRGVVPAPAMPSPAKTEEAKASEAVEPNALAEKTTEEAKPGDAPETKQEEKPASPSAAHRFAALARKEASIVKRQQELKAEEERYKNSRAQPQGPTIEELRARAAKDPLSVIRELTGLSFEELNRVALADGKITPEIEVRRVREELDNFKKEQAKQVADQLESEKKNAESERSRVLSAFREESQQFVIQRADEYPTLNELGVAYLVPQLIEENYGKTQKIMTAKEAADLAEKYLEGVTEKAFNKVQAKRTKANPPPAKVEETKTAQKRTLSELTPATQPPTGKITEAQRMKNALAAMKAAASQND